MHLGTYPYDKIKSDRQLQTLVDKIFPHFIALEAQAERDFYKARGIPFDESHLSPSEPSKPIVQPETITKKLKRAEAAKRFYQDEVAFELLLDEGETDPSLPPLQKPFIRTSAKVTVKHLKKYLQKKLDLTNIKDIEISYRGEVLGAEHSLEYILKSRGLTTESKYPHFHYRKMRPDAPRNE